jgi:psiF repeat
VACPILLKNQAFTHSSTLEINMKTLIIAASVACLFALVPVAHAKHGKAECKVEAGDKKGTERKSFMKSCMAEKRATHKATRTAQQEKMKSCNAEAKSGTMKGTQRKAFMKDCLSKK